MSTFAFIGVGSMGGAIASAVCRRVGGDAVTVYDASEEKRKAFAAANGCCSAESGTDAARAAHFVFLCVKPNLVDTVIGELAPALSEGGKVLASIASGVEIARIGESLGRRGVKCPVIRLMPNTPVRVGAGMVLMALGEGVEEKDALALEDALSDGGLVSRTEEKYIDIATPVFSCSPAYVYMFIEALADGGVACGLPRDKAQQYAAQSVLGAAQMVLETGEHPGALKDAVCSPGGCTIVGVEELEKRGFRAAAAAAVTEAYRKIRG